MLLYSIQYRETIQRDNIQRDNIPWHGDKTLTSVGKKQPRRIRDEAPGPSDSECDPPGADHGGDGAQHHQARPGPGDNIQVRNVN